MPDENLVDENVEDVNDETIVEDDETIIEDDNDDNETIVDEDKTDAEKIEADIKAKKLTQQDKIDFAFSKKQKQFQEEKLKRQEAETKLNEYKQKLQKFQKPKRPEIPEMPDMLDPQYEQKLALREQTFKQQVMYDQKMKMHQHQMKQRQQGQQQQQQAELKKMADTYAERSKDFGIPDEDAKKYEDSIAPFISPKNAKTARFLLAHEKGPLVVKYLSKNPMEAEKLFSMSNMDAAVYISSSLKDKAEKSKPKVSKTPKPGKTISGKGGTTKHGALEGAVFE